MWFLYEGEFLVCIRALSLRFAQALLYSDWRLIRPFRSLRRYWKVYIGRIMISSRSVIHIRRGEALLEPHRQAPMRAAHRLQMAPSPPNLA